MADVQDDAREELVGDQRALAAADLLTDARLAQAGVTLAGGKAFAELGSRATVGILALRP